LLIIKQHLFREAGTSEDFETIAGVLGAIEAIEANDKNSALSFLKRAGSRALDVAIDVGAKVATKAIEASMGS
jgi:hypothetical protein